VSIEPRATYRIQLRPGFGFDEAQALIPYLATLGVSHVYLSPILQAAPASTHGYDVVNHHQVNEELGGAQAYSRFCAALNASGLKQLLDIVPNHMATGGPESPWWWDLLENGRLSRYASYFDVEWNPPEPKLKNRILVPVLPDHYGCVLESGELRLQRVGAQFRIAHGSLCWPLAAHTLSGLLAQAARRCGCEQFKFIADAFEAMTGYADSTGQNAEKRQRNVAVLHGLLADLVSKQPQVAAALDAVISEVNANPDKLDTLLEGQHYRLAFYRAAQRDLSYRRFFAINSLVALRSENEAVFADVHALPLSWLEGKIIHGVRIDHIDGLRDPEEYLCRLRARAPQAWIVVEKILEHDEQLPQSWPVEGTTGYDFLNLVGELLIDPAGEHALAKFYHEFTGEPLDYAAIMADKKLLVLRELLGSDLNRLTALFLEICERHRRHRDYTRHELHEALRAVTAHFPVYRTYVRAATGCVAPRDVRYIEHAIHAAKDARPDLDGEIFEFLKRILTLNLRGEREGELTMRFQQFTPAVMAKGVEDTALYCYNRFAALNEVGSDPRRFGIGLEEFHRLMIERQERQPLSLLTTSTHDTKRSEDVRTRLYVLSEIPEYWSNTVRCWASTNQRHWRSKPDRNAEYLLYQTLVGAWPIAEDRVLAYMEKATREASLHTSWTAPDPDYEANLQGFIRAVLDDREFIAGLETSVREILGPGRVNSLAQTLIKLTAPGIPDLYQGTELWEHSLVDPDNRRSVDFATRRRLLDELREMTVEEAAERSDEGLPKLWLIYRTLALRRKRPEWFGTASDYRPLYAEGSQANNVIAFSRGGMLVVVAPRFSLKTRGRWDDTMLALPGQRWRNELTSESLDGSKLPVDRLFRRFPVCLLAKREN
jgi:(1->4)-alpha-D-glucan 1-alpha-D-glucosylmutase